MTFTCGLPVVPNLKTKCTKKSQVSFMKISKSKQYDMNVLLDSFYFNGHKLGFHPQT